MNDELVRTQYIILKILKVNKATNHMRSMTLGEIAEKEGRSKPNTIYKHIKILEKKDLIVPGAKSERAYGYFIGENGMELLNKFDNAEE